MSDAARKPATDDTYEDRGTLSAQQGDADGRGFAAPLIAKAFDTLKEASLGRTAVLYERGAL